MSKIRFLNFPRLTVMSVSNTTLKTTLTCKKRCFSQEAEKQCCLQQPDDNYKWLWC